MIPKSKPFYPKSDNDLMLEEIRKVFESGKLVSGPYLKKFQTLFSDYIGSGLSTGVNSGTAALEVALRAINVEDKEVITISNSCPSVINAILMSGGKPTLVDVNKETLAIDLDCLSNAITNNTKVVIIVHIAGFIQPNIQNIVDLCKSNNIILVEDCCRALGSKLNGKMAGSYGQISTFSFYAPKLISTGNGGMVVNNNLNYQDKIEILSRGGKIRNNNNYQTKYLAGNWIMDEISAILGIYQMNNIENFIKARNKIAHIYNEQLSNVSYIKIKPSYNNDSLPCYYRFPIFLNKEIDPVEFEKYMNSNGIDLGHYSPMIHQIKLYNKNKKIKIHDISNSEYLSRRLFSLPIFPSMGDGEIKKVIKYIRTYKS